MSKIITPVFRASYVNVFKPRTGDDGVEKYGLSMIFNKNETPEEEIKKVKDAIKAAITEKWGSDEKKWPRNLWIPLRDADNEDRSNSSDPKFDPNYVNAYFMNAKSFQQPGIVDENVDPILDQSQFYSGCYARASVVFKAFDKAGNRGVGSYLNSIMKVRDGDPLGGGAPAHVEFASFRKEKTDAELPFS